MWDGATLGNHKTAPNWFSFFGSSRKTFPVPQNSRVFRKWERSPEKLPRYSWYSSEKDPKYRSVSNALFQPAFQRNGSSQVGGTTVNTQLFSNLYLTDVAAPCLVWDSLDLARLARHPLNDTSPESPPCNHHSNFSETENTFHAARHSSFLIRFLVITA